MFKPTDKTFYIENLGCAKNQVDAEILVRYLEDAGWAMAGTPEKASVILVNSCGFIRPAKEESIDSVVEFRGRFPEKKIILSGCLAQRYGNDLKNLRDSVDGIFGNRALSEITGFLERIDSGAFEVSLGEKIEDFPFRRRFFSFPRSVYVKISEGCDNRCAFCAIPLIRGPLRSRHKTDIIGEIQGLLDTGIFEITLIGQDLGSYGKDTGSGGITELLSDISALEGDFWVRLLYIHPDHFPMGILDICRKDPRILPYFDIPFQHASEDILHRMGRRGNSRTYLALAETIRTALPDAVLRTTFLVGFPGEKKSDFTELLDFQQALKPDWLGVFAYSREEGTPATTMNRLLTVGGKTAEARLRILMEAQEDLTLRAMKRFIGRTLPVLIEEPVAGEDLAIGRIYAQAPEVDGLTVVKTTGASGGSVILCRISGTAGYDLEALPVD